MFARAVFIPSLLPVGNDFHGKKERKRERERSVHGAILFYICTEIRMRDNKLYILKHTHFIPPPLLFIVVSRFFSPRDFSSHVVVVVGKRSVYFFHLCSEIFTRIDVCLINEGERKREMQSFNRASYRMINVIYFSLIIKWYFNIQFV